MKRDNIEFMIAWLDALRRDDLKSVRAMLRADIVWHGLRPDLICHGATEVIDVFSAQRDAYAEIGELELIGAKQHAIMHASGGDIREVAGITLPDGIYNVFRIESGTIRRIDDFARRAEALEAAGLG